VPFNVFEDSLIGSGRATQVVLRLQAVDRNDDIQFLNVCPFFGNRSDSTSHKLDFNSHSTQTGQKRLQLANPYQGFAAHNRKVDGAVSADKGQDTVHERRAFVIG
jgi:hypothetical protein